MFVAPELGPADEAFGAGRYADAAQTYERCARGAYQAEDPKLPAFCSACGAPVKPDEVVRPTPSTIACKYCGASLTR